MNGTGTWHGAVELGWGGVGSWDTLPTVVVKHNLLRAGCHACRGLPPQQQYFRIRGGGPAAAAAA